METRKEMQQRYLETPKRGGVFVVKNLVNGKILLGSSKNLHGPLNKHRFMLSINGHLNKQLQADWNRYGAEAFSFEVVADIVEKKDDPTFSMDDELELAEQIWVEKTNPFSGSGYNTHTRIREA